MELSRSRSTSLALPLCVMCFLLTLAVGSLTFMPFSGFAEETNSEIRASIAPVIAITTDAPENKLSIPITPTPTGTQTSGTVNVNVSTNNPTGYSLTMSSASGVTALTHQTASTNTIPSTTATQALPSALPINTWGYSTAVAPAAFSLVPPLTEPHTIRTTAAQGSTSNTPITFSIYVNTTPPSGTYTNTVLLTATTNIVGNPIRDGMYMQEVTKEMCWDTPLNTRVVLIDARNGQEVFVRKILGGPYALDTCWMETNLRYAGDGDWDSSWGWDDDRYATTAINDTASTYDDIRPLMMTSSGYFGGDQSTAYTVAGVADPGGSSTLDKSVRTDGGTTGNPAGTVYDNNSDYYGYLYNWCATMGGQDDACDDAEHAYPSGFYFETICPAGWILPTGGNNTETEFGHLNRSVNSGSTGSDVGLRNNFLATYSGSYAGGLSGQGVEGSYWSHSASGANPYSLYFSSSLVEPGTNANDKSVGNAVRCILLPFDPM